MERVGKEPPQIKLEGSAKTAQIRAGLAVPYRFDAKQRRYVER